MLNSDAPSTARLKSQPEPSTEAKLEHGHPSVNRSGELIYFSMHTDRRVMGPLIGANEDPRRHLARSCTHRTRATHPKYTNKPQNFAWSHSIWQQPGPNSGKQL